MQYDVDMNAMKAYIIEKFKAEGDFEFLKEGLLEEMVTEMLSLDQAYMAKLGEDDEYDDDDVYDILFETMQKKTAWAILTSLAFPSSPSATAIGLWQTSIPRFMRKSSCT